jgi:surface carbohydrate biosynthesis protein
MASAIALPPLYLLVEETSRELASRVLLATVGTNAGFTCHIIPQWFAWEHMDDLPPGIMLFKGNNSTQSNHMNTARAAGHRVAALEEEILGVTKDEAILRYFQSDTVDACELFLVQGKHARDILAATHPRLAERIVVTGNPRTDLLRPPFDGPIRQESEAIRREYGDYILVNTNFGATNPSVEDTIAFRDLCIRVGVLDPKNRRDREEFVARCQWERGNMALMARIIAECAASSSLPRVIIRPHPAENLDKWRAAHAGEPRISIIREGDHVPWTAAARLLLHTGCTTGVEATLLGTPVLCLRGGESHWHHHLTSNHVNQIANSAEEAMKLISATFSGDENACASSPNMWNELRRQLLPETNGTAAEAIVEALLTLARTNSASSDSSRKVARAAEQAVVFSGQKIDATEFNPVSISSGVTRFAGYLNHPKPPSVDRLGDAVIRIAPSDNC